MKYVVLNDRVILKCGWYKKIIMFSQIEKVAIENIKANLLADSYSPIKFPGYALGRVYTFDKGLVYMCATRVNKKILLIYLKNEEKVGITPKNIEEFKEFLLKKAASFQEEK
ncbi:PH domain-containing protein [Caldicellulosiruptoraceae bacterium PP1]